MKDVALIAVNMDEGYTPCENAETAIGNSLEFIEKIDPIEQDTEEVIYGTFPILLVGKYGTQLEAYAQEGMSFQLHDTLSASTNEAGQSLEEVLDLLDIHNVYLCGLCTEQELRQLCTSLSQIKIRPYLLKGCIGYQSEESHERFLDEMKASGVKVALK